MGSKILNDIMKQQQQQNRQKRQHEAQQTQLQVMTQSPGAGVAAMGGAVAKAAVPQNTGQALPVSPFPSRLDLIHSGGSFAQRQRGQNAPSASADSGTGLDALQRDLDRLSPTGAGIINDEVTRSIEELSAKYGVSLAVGDNLYDKAGELEGMLNTRISETTGYLKEQEYNKKAAYYSAFMQNENFAANSKPVASDGVSPFVASDYDYINKQVSSDASRATPNAASAASMAFAALSHKSYDYLTDDETAVYNYLYSTQGKKSAEEFIDFIDETLNYRYGQKIAGDMRDSVLKQIGYGAWAGLERFGGGIKQLFSEDAAPTSPTQFAGTQIREDLAETGPKILGNSLGQVGFDLMNTTGYMLPSILLSRGLGAAGAAPAVSQIAGSATMGLASGGNAYTYKINEGYSPNEARAYASLVGASEGFLQYALGGIEGLSSGGATKLTGKVTQLDNAFGRFAKTVAGNRALATGSQFVGNLLSEGLEEGLQEILEPVIGKMVLGEELDINLENAAYAALLGMASAGTMNAASMMANLSTPAERQAFLAGQQAVQEGVSPAQGDSMPAAVQSDTAQNNAPLTLAEILADVKGAEARIVEQQQKASPEAAKADANEVVEKLRNSIPQIQSEEVMSVLTGTEFARGSKKLTEQVSDFFNSIGNAVFRKGFGNVVLNMAGIKSDIAHGIGRAKAITFSAVPDIIANGVEIDYQQNWKGRGYDTYIFAGPVEMDGKRTYVAAVVVNSGDNHFYL